MIRQPDPRLRDVHGNPLTDAQLRDPSVPLVLDLRNATPSTIRLLQERLEESGA